MSSHQLINQDSGDYEYYTPIEIVEAAKEVMGSIDLDPASSSIANRKIKAKRFYKVKMQIEELGIDGVGLPYLTSLKGGLDHQWAGNIWMNHPFSRTEAPCREGCTKKICITRGYHTSIPIPGNKEWVEKIVEDYRYGAIDQACCITFASTSEKWIQPLMPYIQCFLYPRTRYYRSNGELTKASTKGSVVTYLGTNVSGFRQVFKKFGAVKR